MNSFISSLVSATTAPRDFSLFTVNPPDSQSHAEKKSKDTGSQDNMQGIVMGHLIGASARIGVPSPDLRAHLGRFLLSGVSQLADLGECCFAPLLGFASGRISKVVDAANRHLRLALSGFLHRGRSFSASAGNVAHFALCFAHAGNGLPHSAAN